MAELKLRVKNENRIKDKPRVYFTCHPDDFERYFETVVADIFKTQDCAIYYTEDMTEELSEENLSLEIGMMQLLVVPVTFKLLSTPNRAMDVDIPYAMANAVRVLPLMMEDGIEEVYALPKNFGQRQYIKPNSIENGAIEYEKKLSDYLSDVLVNDELRKKVRMAFDAYIFLSYRKKDRALANELMRHIHKIPEFRDLAIWYDEYITLGEDWEKDINEALDKSEMFALLVTPNLLEDPNFVKDVEYKRAKGVKPILPVEMVETDKIVLSEMYDEIPQCAMPEEVELKSRIGELLSGASNPGNDNNAEHLYLIGIAYYNGIDVEVDRERGLEMITAAAEMEYLEAMVFLKKYYDQEHKNKNALVYARMIYSYHLTTLGEEHPDTLKALSDLGVAHAKTRNYMDAVHFTEKAYNLRCKLLGEEHPDTIKSLKNLTKYYGKLKNHKKMIQLQEKKYNLYLKIYGEEHPDTFYSLGQLATAYDRAGDYDTALQIRWKIYRLHRRIHGEEHPDTLNALSDVAREYDKTFFDHRTALQLYKKVYKIQYKNLGKYHKDTLESLSNIASCYSDLDYSFIAVFYYTLLSIREKKVIGYPDEE